MFRITRDGKTVADNLSTEFAVLDWFHRNTSQSADWMCKHEGYAVEGLEVVLLPTVSGGLMPAHSFNGGLLLHDLCEDCKGSRTDTIHSW